MRTHRGPIAKTDMNPGRPVVESVKRLKGDSDKNAEYDTKI